MRGSLFTGNPALDLGGRCRAITLEEDRITKVGLDRLRGGSKDSPEETNGSVWVGENIGDIRPLELALVTNRVKLQAAPAGNRSGNQGFHHILVEDVSSRDVRAFV